MNARFLTLAVAALTASTAVGQINPMIGAAQGSGDDTVLGPLTLSFPFTFPDGTVATDVFADSNGRIFWDMTAGFDFSESLAELSSDPSMICVMWHDINPIGGGAIGDVFFNDLGTSALITWNDVVDFGAAAGTEYTVQVELFPDSSFIVRSDARVSLGDGIIGCSAGNGVALGALTDISNDLPFSSGGVSEIYEDFDGVTFNWDLVNCDTTFAPDGAGGYNVTTTCPLGTPRPTPSVVNVGGPACTPTVGNALDLTYSPDGAGGYNVSLGGAMDPNFAMGTDLGLGDDTVANVVLPFTFAMPGGNMVADLDVDSNGRLFETGIETSDFTESLGEFFGDATSMICAFWDDLSPNNGGAVWSNVAASGAQSITWDGVPEFVAVGANTFQVQLFSDGTITMHYTAMSATDGIVGLSAGNGAVDPGESDLSAGGIATGGVAEVYEEFTGDVDFAAPQLLPDLAALTAPVIGTNFDLLIQNNPGSLGDFYLLGNPQSFDLTPIGIPCFLETDGILATIAGVPGTPYTLNVPNLPGLVGQSLNTQGATLDTTAGNPFFVLFTNSIDFTFGDI